MNVGGGRTFRFLHGALLAGLAGGCAFSAQAQVHKCKNSDGSLTFQEAPCGSAGGIPIAPQPPAGVGKSAAKTKPADTTNKAMNDAFQSRMDKGDYDGALAFATTDAQKAQARRKVEEKRVKCESLSVKAKQAQTDFQTRGEKWKAKADAADAEYRNHCR